MTRLSGKEPRSGGVTGVTKAAAALGLFAGGALAVLVNVASARAYRRWDVTSAQLYSLSPATKSTLRGLSEPVEVTVLLSASDPLTVSVRHLLLAYQSETSRLIVRYLDPDRSPAEFLAFQKKHGILAGQTQDGRVIADATLVVNRGERTWFLGPADLVDTSEADEGRARPKLEQGITTAIRNVLSGERVTVCFSRGHGEIPLREGGKSGLGELAHRLARNNYDAVEVETAGTRLAQDPWQACRVAVVAGPQAPFGDAESAGLVRYVERGGNVLFFLNPLPDGDKKRVLPSGLDPVLALFGVEAHGDLVVEQDPSRRLPKGGGEVFFAEARPPPVSRGLLDDGGGATRMLFVLSQSFGRVAGSPVVAVDVAASSKSSFGMADFFSWRDDGATPERKTGDREGPLGLAVAAERPAGKDPATAASGKESDKGARGVFVGSVSVAQNQAFQEPLLRGGAALTESALSWLAARPEMVDIPQKPSMPAGLRLTEEAVSQVRNYVTIYIPLAAALIGVAIFLRRRSTERS